MANQVWFNGKLVPPDHAKVSVFDHGLLYGDGVFEGIRCYDGRLFKLDTHLRRLFDSAQAIRLTIPYSRSQLDQAVRETVSQSGASPDAYVRLCVTRGVGTLGLNPLKCRDANVFIIADEIALYDRQDYEKGMAVITASTIRNHPAALSPRIKSMNYLNNIMAKVEALDAGVMEAVMLNHQGFVAECTGDNIFIVRPGGDRLAGEPVLITPPLHAGVLEGVTMNAVVGLAEAAGLTVHRRDMTRYDLYTCDEMFLTGTAAEIIPVTRVDGRSIGTGVPGPVTRKLTEAFCALVRPMAPED